MYKKLFTFVLPAISGYLAAQAEAEGDSCDYTNGHYEDSPTPKCINVKEYGSSQFTLPPLFPEPVTLVYAADEPSDEEIDDWYTGVQGDLSTYYGTPIIAWWLEFDPATVKADEVGDVPMITNMISFMADSIGPPSGGNGGCDGALGKTCTDSLTAIIRNLTFVHSHPDLPIGIDNAVFGGVEGCPELIFALKPPAIAIQNPDDPSENMVLDSGNSSSVLYSFNNYASTLSELRRGALASIVTRYEMVEYGGVRKNDTSLLSVAYACTALGQTAEPEEDGEEEDDEEDAETPDDNNEDNSTTVCIGSACPNAGQVLHPQPAIVLSMLAAVACLFIT